MVSTTPVERPEAMSCAPSGATSTASITLGRGEGSYTPPVRGDPSWQESPMESRRGEKSGPRTILGSARTGLLATAGPHSGALSLELAIGGKVYRWSLGHVCTIASSPSGAGMSQREPEGAVWCLTSRKQIHLCLSKNSPNLLHLLGVKPSLPGPQPLPRPDVCSYIEQEYRLLSARVTCPGTTQGSGAPACIRGANADLPGGWYKKPPLCCRCVPTHGDFLGLEESVWVLKTWPASPGSWCATWDGDHSTDRGQDGHSWPLPNRSGMHPSLVLRGDKELPEPGPETRTKVSS